MHAYNSDGYILIDMKEADITQSSQYIPGIYNRIVEEVTKANKLAVVINAGKLTPMAAAINKMLNYYVITTSLYIFKVNTNDIVIIEQAGSSTVEVSIVPTLLSGTKIADYAIGDQEGSLYAPEFQTEINDSVKSDHLTWSSDKIDTQLGTKANSSDLATVATTGSYDDLTNKPTIPTKVSELQNDSGYVAGSSLATVATTGSYTDLTNKPTIPTKVSELQNDSGYITDSALTDYQTKTDNTLDTTAKTITGAINEHQSEIGISEYDSTQTYNIGDYVLYNGDMYFCTKNSVTGTWNSNNWRQSTIVIDLSNIVVKRTLTETTTGNGNIVNHISVDNGIIVGASCTSQEAIVTTFLNSTGTYYSFHIVSPTSQAPVVANTKVTIEFYMIPRRRIVTDT